LILPDDLPWEAIRLLAAPAAEQVAFLQNLDLDYEVPEEDIAWELWLPLEEAWDKLYDARQQDTASLEDLRRHPLFSLSRLLDAMTDRENLWSIEAVQSAVAWETVRSLARALLDDRANLRPDR
jgi:hypothetical protein